MIIREIKLQEKSQFNEIVNHPLQSWEWGEFRQNSGLDVVRLGVFKNNKLHNAYQLTIHPLPIPQLDLSIIYFPRGPMPDKLMLQALTDLGKKKNVVFAKLEPNISLPVRKSGKKYEEIKDFLLKNNCQPGRPLFTPYTFKINLQNSEEELLAAMKEKTRYNLRLSQKRGVEVIEDNSPEAFKTYLQLTEETTQRQGFFAHDLDYHRKMWATLHPAGIAHLLVAKYKDQILTTWILFTFKDILYYPYGASSREHHELMPSYAMMWAAIKFGQKKGLKTFDLWGSLGPEPDPKDPWFGFHRFKAGFGPELYEFIGTYDLVINPQLYPLVRLAENWRQKLLHLKLHGSKAIKKLRGLS